MFKDLAVLFTNVYTALIHGIYYSFFEEFPLVYGLLYEFNIGEPGVLFTCIAVGCSLAMGIYFYFLQYMLIPDILKNGLRAQEPRLRTALIFELEQSNQRTPDNEFHPTVPDVPFH